MLTVFKHIITAIVTTDTHTYQNKQKQCAIEVAAPAAADEPELPPERNIM